MRYFEEYQEAKIRNKVPEGTEIHPDLAIKIEDALVEGWELEEVRPNGMSAVIYRKVGDPGTIWALNIDKTEKKHRRVIRVGRSQSERKQAQEKYNLNRDS